MVEEGVPDEVSKGHEGHTEVNWDNSESEDVDGDPNAKKTLHDGRELLAQGSKRLSDSASFDGAGPQKEGGQVEERGVAKVIHDTAGNALTHAVLLNPGRDDTRIHFEDLELNARVKCTEGDHAEESLLVKILEGFALHAELANCVTCRSEQACGDCVCDNGTFRQETVVPGETHTYC